jgi:hypothetical protein
VGDQNSAENFAIFFKKQLNLRKNKLTVYHVFFEGFLSWGVRGVSVAHAIFLTCHGSSANNDIMTIQQARAPQARHSAPSRLAYGCWQAAFHLFNLGIIINLSGSSMSY